MAHNEQYKIWHKPSKDPNAKTKQGYYQITNPSKYMGNPNLIIYRSSWEFSFCKWCDFSPSIVKWSSEPVRIPYYDRVSKLAKCKELHLDPNNPHNWVTKFYNTDFWIQVKKADGTIEKWFIEIKPQHKLGKPKQPEKNAPIREITKYNNAVKEYLINEAKFAAIREWANKNGAYFWVFTEVELQRFGIIGGRFDYKEVRK
jgi:hypothetical protein